MSDLELAAPSSALGKLQRGRGAGWIEAVERSDGRELLMTCLAVDPRWDSQVEDRASYYAELCIALAVPASQIDPQGLKDDDARWLRFDVLAEMARRDDTEAIAILQDYVRPGPDADTLVWHLSRLPNGSGLVGLEQLIIDRFGADELAELVDDSRSRLPWDHWAEQIPAISRAIAAADVRSKSNRRSKPAPPQLDGPLEPILAFDWGAVPPKALVHRTTNTATGAEVDLIRHAAVGPWSPTRGLALRLLGQRRDPFAIEVAAQTFSTDTIGRERAASYRYLRDLEAAVTLPLAREWILADDDRSGVAATLMAMHSESEDVPSIRAAFNRAWERDWMYEICSLVEALGRHPDHGPFPELRMVFTDVAYSYPRRRAARSMAAVDPDFSTAFAVECLWDCEAETRLVGVDASHLDDRITRARIEVLAADQAGDQAVRSAAATRLTDPS